MGDLEAEREKSEWHSDEVRGELAGGPTGRGMDGGVQDWIRRDNEWSQGRGRGHGAVGSTEGQGK